MPSLGELIAPRRLGRDFRWLISSSWTTDIGDGIALSAAPLLIASLTSSPILVAGGAADAVPAVAAVRPDGGSPSPIITTGAAGHDRRWIARDRRAGLVAFLVTGHVTVWIVLGMAFLYGTAEVFANTAGSTLMPMLVKPADLGVGNARLQGGFLVGNQLIGPPLGAFLFAAGRSGRS